MNGSMHDLCVESLDSWWLNFGFVSFFDQWIFIAKNRKCQSDLYVKSRNIQRFPTWLVIVTIAFKLLISKSIFRMLIFQINRLRSLKFLVSRLNEKKKSLDIMPSFTSNLNISIEENFAFDTLWKISVYEKYLKATALFQSYLFLRCCCCCWLSIEFRKYLQYHVLVKALKYLWTSSCNKSRVCTHTHTYTLS